MHATNNEVYRQATGHWVVKFPSRAGETVPVQVIDENLVNEAKVIDRARRIMVELTALAREAGAKAPMPQPPSATEAFTKTQHASLD
ncbi:hypothetical protein J2T09_004678 [Neorhizobium huautlense]|uniref:DUF2188 domain-containing protein n=1 Tax=Neorhizobium huautlense TaxID=67774 RepID=A0ABT9Q0N6_9HYPH|nr:hypothetical protein [Neorhizobium huautlense]MDP9839898.1 hypothetical protein [Neorhizobium huautlense]